MRGRTEITALAVYGAGLALLVGLTLLVNHGAFAYSLDDAYIHLALAENVANGHYGLNLGEPSSPSSSILWPFLLAPFSGLPWFELVPLIFNVGCVLATLCVVTRALESWLGALLPRMQLHGLLLLLVLCCNFWGMPLNGMEHSAQLLLTVWAAVGLVTLVETGRCSPALLAGLSLAPLVRFENFSLLVMGALVLVVRRRRKEALLVAVIALGGLVGFTVFLDGLGLPWLPSSVMVKSEVVSAGSAADRMLEAGESVLEGVTKSRILALLVPLFFLIRRTRRDAGTVRARKDLLYVLFLSGIIGAHLLAGKYDWQGRYEIYLLISGAMTLLFCFRLELAELSRTRPAAAWMLIAAALFVGKNQIDATVRSPLYAKSTYEINYLMHRFAVDHWRDRVAVHDVGWVSFQNPHYVLDLWGLGSDEAFRRRLAATDNEWAARMARARGVDLAMLWEKWMSESGGIPARWEKIAELEGQPRRIGRPALVGFYLTTPSRRRAAFHALEAFRAELPAGVTLSLPRQAVPQVLDATLVGVRDDPVALP